MGTRDITKVIMLDIDGVLNNRTSLFLGSIGLTPIGMTNHVMDHGCVRLFEYILMETGAGYVISSTWRFLGIDLCKETLHRYGFNKELITTRFIGATPRLSGDVKRGDEIAAWLKDNPQYSRCVILDDDSDMLPNQILVKTDGKHGLSVTNALKCIELLNKG